MTINIYRNIAVFNLFVAMVAIVVCPLAAMRHDWVLVVVQAVLVLINSCCLGWNARTYLDMR